MLTEITIYNKKQLALYSFLVIRDTSRTESAQAIMDCEDLEEVLEKELANHPTGYFGIAKDFQSEQILTTLGSDVDEEFIHNFCNW